MRVIYQSYGILLIQTWFLEIDKQYEPGWQGLKVENLDEPIINGESDMTVPRRPEKLEGVGIEARG